ncbi:C-13 antigen [Plasmodium sp. DRC-Itaito]|nr:C-13 antigen [Plasmodium sp. DRC-Itaito]
MNYNNNYVDYNIHDRRKTNNANIKEDENSWSNMNYSKGNNLNNNVMKRGGHMDINMNDINSINNFNNFYSGHVTDVNNTGDEESAHLLNKNLQLDNTYVHNLINPNDNVTHPFANNINKNTSLSNYVSVHPVIGRNKTKDVSNSSYNNRSNTSTLNNNNNNSNNNSNSNIFNNNNNNSNIFNNNDNRNYSYINNSNTNMMKQSSIILNNNSVTNNLVNTNFNVNNKISSHSNLLYNSKDFTNNNNSNYFQNNNNSNNRINNYNLGIEQNYSKQFLKNNDSKEERNVILSDNLPFVNNVKVDNDLNKKNIFNNYKPNYNDKNFEQNNMNISSNSMNQFNNNNMKTSGDSSFVGSVVSGVIGSTASNFFQNKFLNNKENNVGSNKGIVHNIFESLTNDKESKNEINNLVQQKVANMVINEIEKKIEINQTSFICNKLSVLREYFDVTHAYVIQKILFILVPYVYIRKALCESRTYYVYTHLKRKMESSEKNKTFNSAFILNNDNANFTRPNSSINHEYVQQQGGGSFFYNDQSKGYMRNNNNNNNNINSNNINSNNINNNNINNNNSNMNNNNMNNSNMNNSNMNNNVIRHNSNDINYVDYSNVGIFKADLYIPLMSSITYILLYTLTITAQKKNSTFNPDNLFNISSYVFILLFLETAIIKFLFLLTCRDINLSFLHILSFISYKFVIMCALIITKIFFYFLYFIYASAFGVGGTFPDMNIKNNSYANKKMLSNNSHNTFKNMNYQGISKFSVFNIVLFLNSTTTYRLTQLYFYITVAIQMIQIFKSIHLYIHDNNSNLSHKVNIKRINVLILIFSLSQIFLCWILTPPFT